MSEKSELTGKQLRVLREAKACKERGENFKVGASHSKETVRSLHKRDLLEKLDIGVFEITSEGERVLQEEESKAEDKNLGDFS